MDTVSISYPTLYISLVMYGNLDYAYLDYRVIVWYTALAKQKYNIVVNALNIVSPSASSSYQYGFLNYKTNNSIFFLALSMFDYSAVNDPSNAGFTWSITTSSNSTRQLVIQTSIDSQFYSINHVYLLINRFTCPITHPIRGINRTTNF